LERLHSLVNEADFSVFDERIDDFIVAVIIAPQLARWLLNTRIATIQGQILNWLAAWWTFHADLPDKRITSLPPGIHEKVEAIRRSHYGRGFSYEELWSTAYPERPRELLKHYEDVSKELTGAAPPEILRLRNCELNGVDLGAWGLTGADDWIGFDFSYRFAYIRDNDWAKYVVQGQVSELGAAESSEELRQKWLHTIELYPTRKSHVFGVLGGEAHLGFIYLLRGENSGYYKLALRPAQTRTVDLGHYKPGRPRNWCMPATFALLR
jgi:hypothetical protein